MMTMYTGTPRRAFQLPVAHPEAFTRRLWLPLYGPCVISEHACRDEITGHNTGISLLLSTSAWALLSAPTEH